MAVTKEERDRILNMVEGGQVSAVEAAQLLDALVEEIAVPSPGSQNRTLRIWVTDTATRNRKVNMTTTLPVGLLRASLQTLASVVPLLRNGRAEQLVSSLENGTIGRVMDIQDFEDGKRVEIFLER